MGLLLNGQRTANAISPLSPGGSLIDPTELVGGVAPSAPHGFAGAVHTPSTLASVNSLVSDATLDDSAATRGHAVLAGQAGGQTLRGGTAPSEALNLEGSGDATKGPIGLNAAARVFDDGSAVFGGVSADASAIIDLISTTKGALVPRLTTAQRDAIATPATGLLVYNATTGRHEAFNGTSWGGLGGGGAANAIAVGTTIDPSTTSGVFVTIPEMSVTIPVTSGIVWVLFTGTFGVMEPNRGDIALRVDAVAEVADRTLRPRDPAGVRVRWPAVTAHLFTGLSVASHTFEARWLAGSGVFSTDGINRSIIAVEVL